MSLLSYLPTRSAEEILGGQVRVVLGRQEYFLPVLPIERNEAWQKSQDEALGPILTKLEDQQTDAQVFAFLCSQAPVVYAQLVSYDVLGIEPELGRIERVLPEWAEARRTATEAQVISAFLGVMAAAYPLAVELLRLVDAGTAIGMTVSKPTAKSGQASSGAMSRSERRSAARRAKSAAGSPTSS